MRKINIILVSLLINSLAYFSSTSVNGQALGCGDPHLESNHGGYCSSSTRLIDTAYFNGSLDSVLFSYGASGANCAGIGNEQIYLNGLPISTPAALGQYGYYKTTTSGTYRFAFYQMIQWDFTIELINTSPNLVATTEEDNMLIIYPNPTSNSLSIKTNMKITGIMILNIAGAFVKSVELTRNPINVSDLENGIYFIKIVSEDNIVIKKFIKQ